MKMRERDERNRDTENKRIEGFKEMNRDNDRCTEAGLFVRFNRGFRSLSPSHTDHGDIDDEILRTVEQTSPISLRSSSKTFPLR